MLGVHKTIHRRFQQPTAAVFLDRDGVIVEETGYLHKPGDVQMIPGASAAIGALNAASIATVVVTNQAGIARGYYDWPAFEQTQSYIEERIFPAVLDGTWACGYHPDGSGPLASDHAFRKPNPGMVIDAVSEMNLDRSTSWLVGDKTIDIQTAINAGLAGAILVRTGYGAGMEAEVCRILSAECSILVCDSLTEAVEEILRISRL
jgi:D-glycero-D-manno-heptose 1,7-bisphosphate phosphatase